jgi:hypothetical protein
MTRGGGHGRRPRRWPTRTGRAALCLLALAGASVAGAGLAIDPTLACGLLGDQGLRVRDGYRDAGRGAHRCTTIDQPFPRGASGGNRVRFSAAGTRARVDQLQLELALGSTGDGRPVLEAFAALSDLLSARSLGRPLPAEARRAVATGIPGTWRSADAEVALERITGAMPSLRFVIR